MKQEVARKKVEGPNVYSKTGKKQKIVSEQEKEKIIEVLLSQERVLTLLYDKTFPPRQAM